MIQKIVLLLISFILLTGCTSKPINNIETINGMHSDFWVSGEYKDVVKQWVGHNINEMLSHSDYKDCKYNKMPLSPHINIYLIQLSVWRYAKQGVTISNEFVIHVFTNKENNVISIAFPQQAKQQSKSNLSSRVAEK